MHEYDQDAPRDRSRFWKLGLVVTTVVAGLAIVADVTPLIGPLITHAQRRFADG